MTSLQNNFGWAGPAPVDILATNRQAATAVAVGDCLMLDWRRVNAASTSNTAGLQTAGIANAILPATIDLAFGIFGIALQAAAVGRFFKMRLEGQCDFVSVAGTVVLATDAAYGPVNGSAAVTKLTVTNTGAAGALPTKVIFIPLTARTGAGLTDGWFSGSGGFGTVLV